MASFSVLLLTLLTIQCLVALMPLSCAISTDPNLYAPGTTTPLTSGPVGTHVQVTGTSGSGAAEPYSTVTVYWENLAGAVIAASTAGGDGSYSIIITIPSAEAGIHYIVVNDGEAEQGVPFQVTPSLENDVDRALPGDTLVLTGNGFGANSPISVTFESTTISPSVSITLSFPSITTNATGSFSATLTVPSVTPAQYDTYTLEAVDPDYRLYAIPFPIDYYLVVAPESGPTGVTFTISGRIPASVAYTLSIDATNIGSGTSAADGAFSYTYTIPSLISVGDHGIYVKWVVGSIENIRQTTFTVSPEPITILSSLTGAAGTTITISGTGFTPLADILVNIGTTVANSTDLDSRFGPTNIEGAFTNEEFVVPALTPGVYSVFVTDEYGAATNATTVFTVTAMITRSVPEFTVIPDPIGYPQWTWFNFEITPPPPMGGSYTNIMYEIVYPDGGTSVLGPFATYPGTGVLLQPNECTFTPGQVGSFEVKVYSDEVQEIDGVQYSAFSSDVVSFLAQEENVTYPWPTADFSYNPVEPFIGQEVQFDASSSFDVDGSIVGYTWWVENTPGGEFDYTTIFESPVPAFTYVFDSVGTYRVYLFVVDNDNWTMNILRQITVRDPIYHDLTIEVEGSGSITNWPLGVNTFFEDENITVTASAGSGWVFSHWLLDGLFVGSDESFSIIMDTEHTLVAMFSEETFELTIINEGYAGSTSPTEGAHSYATDTEVNVTFIPITDGEWVFDYWLLDGVTVINASSITITMDANHVLTAVSRRQYAFLKISTQGEGTTFPPASVEAYRQELNTQLDVTATPSSDWNLSHWELDGVHAGTERLYTAIFDDNHELTAVFTPVTPPTYFRLTIEVIGQGSTNPPAGFHQAIEDTTVLVNALPETNWILSNWTLDNVNVSTSDSYSILMDDNHVLRAVFTENPLTVDPRQYNLTIDVVGSGSTEPGIGVHSYAAESNITVTAYPPDGWTLDCWMLDGQNAGETQTITCSINAESSLTAVFIEDVAPIIPPELIPPIIGGGTAIGLGSLAYREIHKGNESKRGKDEPKNGGADSEPKSPKNTLIKLELIDSPKVVGGNAGYTIKLKIKNLGLVPVDNVGVLVYSTSEIKLENVAETIPSVPVLDGTDVIFKFTTIPNICKGEYKLNFVAKAQNAIFSVHKEVTVHARKIGLLVGSKNGQKLTSVKSWLNTLSLHYDELHSADNVLILLGYDAIIVSSNFDMPAKWGRVLQSYVDNDGVLLKTKDDKNVEIKIKEKISSIFKI